VRFRLRTCWVVTCDVCENDFDWEDMTVHFDDESELRSELVDAGWVVKPGSNAAVCDSCDRGQS
jgi:hypothetical protein